MSETTAKFLFQSQVMVSNKPFITTNIFLSPDAPKLDKRCHREGKGTHYVNCYNVIAVFTYLLSM